MIQEIHFKLLRRVTEKRGEIRDSNWDICPKIKKILDANIMQSRKWRAVWDGESKYQVKYNTRFVTVDLDSRSCDCRNFDLTGIPCSHALAAIYDRRGQPVDYLSDYYKRDKYAAAYAFPLTALKGVDYWDFHDDEVLLPPELPKKLRGKPKRLRRREEWEGGTQGKAKVTEEQVQRWSSKRVHHCSKCKKPGNRKPKCPELVAVGEQEQGDTTATEGGQQQESRTEFAGHEQDVGIGEEQDFGMGEDIGGHEETVRTATKLMDQADGSASMSKVQRKTLGIKRPKLAIRRPKCSNIPTQASQTSPAANEGESANQGGHLMHRVLGPLGETAVYKPLNGWAFTAPPYNQVAPWAARRPGPSAPRKQTSSAHSAPSPPRRSNRLRNANFKTIPNTEDDPVIVE